jgi:hypothetical protein
LSLLVVPVVFTYVRGFEDFVVGVFNRSQQATATAKTDGE